LVFTTGVLSYCGDTRGGILNVGMMMAIKNNTTVFLAATESWGCWTRTHNAVGEIVRAWLGHFGSPGATRVAICPRGHKYVPTAEHVAAFNTANNRPIESYMGAKTSSEPSV
jgi:hypothetical protein